MGGGRINPDLRGPSPVTTENELRPEVEPSPVTTSEESAPQAASSPEAREVLAHLEDREAGRSSAGATEGPRQALRQSLEQLTEINHSDTNALQSFIRDELLPAIGAVQSSLRSRPGQLRADLAMMERAYRRVISSLPAPLENDLTQQLSRGLNQVHTDMGALRSQLRQTLPETGSEASPTREQVEHARIIASLSESLEDTASLQEDTTRWHRLLDRLSDEAISPEHRLEQYSAILRRYGLARAELNAAGANPSQEIQDRQTRLTENIDSAQGHLLQGFQDQLTHFESVRQNDPEAARALLRELQTMATRLTNALPSHSVRLRETLNTLRQYYQSVMEFHEAHVPTRHILDGSQADAHVAQRERYQAGLEGVNRATQTLRDLLRETLTVPEGQTPTPSQLENARLVTQLSQDLGHYAGARMDLERWENLLSEIPDHQISGEVRSQNFLEIFQGWMEILARTDGTVTPEPNAAPIAMSAEAVLARMRRTSENFQNQCGHLFPEGSRENLPAFLTQLIDHSDRRLIPRLNLAGLQNWLSEVQNTHEAIDQATTQEDLPTQRAELLQSLQSCIELRDADGVRRVIDLLESSLPEDATDLDRIQVYSSMARALHGGDIGPENRILNRGREIAARLENTADADLATRSQSLMLALNFYTTARLSQSQNRVQTQLSSLRDDIRTELRDPNTEISGQDRVELAGNLVQINQTLLDADLGQAERAADIDGALGVVDGMITWTVTTLSFGMLDEPGAETRESIRQSAREGVGHQLLQDLHLWHMALLETEDLPEDVELQQSSAMVQQAMAYRQLASGDPSVVDSEDLERSINLMQQSLGRAMSHQLELNPNASPEEEAIFEAVSEDLETRLEQAVGDGENPGNPQWIAGLQAQNIREFATAAQNAHTLLRSEGSPPQTHAQLAMMGLDLEPEMERQLAAAQIFSQLGLENRVRENLAPLRAQLESMSEPEQASARTSLAILISTTYQQTGLTEESNSALQDIVDLGTEAAPLEIRQSATLARAMIAMNEGHNSEAIELLATLPQHPLAQTLLENLQNGTRVQRSLQTVAILRSISQNYIQRAREHRDSWQGDLSRSLAETFDWEQSASPEVLERDTLAGWEEVERLISTGEVTSLRAAIDQVSHDGRFEHFIAGSSEFHIGSNVERFMMAVENPAISDESFEQQALELGGQLEADNYNGAAGQIYQILMESPRVGERAQARLEGLPTAVRIRTSINTLWNILCISRGTPGIIALSSTSGVSVSDAATNGAMAIVPFGIARAVGSGMGSAFVGSSMVRSVLRSSTALNTGKFVVSTVSEAAAFSLSSGLMMSLMSGGRMDPTAHFGSEFASMLVIFALCHGLGMGSQRLGNRARQTELFGMQSAQTGQRVLRPWAQRGLGALHYGSLILGLERAEAFNVDVGIREEEESIPYMARLFSAALMDAQMRVAGSVVNRMSGGELHRMEQETQSLMEAHRLLPALERMGFERPDWRGRTSPEAQLVWNALMTRVARGESAAEVEASVTRETQMELERMVQLVFGVRPDATGRMTAQGRELYANLFTYLQTRGRGEMTQELRTEMSQLFQLSGDLLNQAGISRNARNFSELRQQFFFNHLRQGIRAEQLQAFADNGPEVRRRIDQMVEDLLGPEGSRTQEGRQFITDLFLSAFTHADGAEAFLNAWGPSREAAPQLGRELRSRVAQTYGFAPGSEASVRIIRAIFERILANGSNPAQQFGAPIRSEGLHYTNPNVVRRLQRILRTSEITDPAEQIQFFEWAIQNTRTFDEVWSLDINVRQGRQRVVIEGGQISVQRVSRTEPTPIREAFGERELIQQAARDEGRVRGPERTAEEAPVEAAPEVSSEQALRQRIRSYLQEGLQLAQSFRLTDQIGVLRATAFPEFARRLATSENPQVDITQAREALNEGNRLVNESVPEAQQSGIRETLFREILRGELQGREALQERLNQLIEEAQPTRGEESVRTDTAEPSVLPREAFVIRESVQGEQGQVIPGLVARSEPSDNRGMRRFTVYQGPQRLGTMELPENMPAALGRALLTQAAEHMRRPGRTDLEFTRMDELPEPRQETARQGMLALRRELNAAGLAVPEGTPLVLSAAGEVSLRQNASEAPPLQMGETLSQLVFLTRTDSPFMETAREHQTRLEGLEPGSAEYIEVLNQFAAARDNIAHQLVEDHRQPMVAVTRFLESLQERPEIGRAVVRVESRPKAQGDIIPKMMRRGFASMDALTDIAGTRIIVHNYDDALAVLRAIQTNSDLTIRPRIGRDGQVRTDEGGQAILRDQLGRMVREERSDGDLGYRALHLTVMRDGRPVEIQIQTEAMAEWGRIQHDLGYKPESRLREIGDPPLETPALPTEVQQALDIYFLEASQYISDLEMGATRGRRRPFDERVALETAIPHPQVPEARRREIQSAIDEMEALFDMTERVQRRSERRGPREDLAEIEAPPSVDPGQPFPAQTRVPDMAAEDAMTYLSNAFLEATRHASMETATAQIETWIQGQLQPHIDQGGRYALNLEPLVGQIQADLALVRGGVSEAPSRQALRDAYERLTEISDAFQRLSDLALDQGMFREVQFNRILSWYEGVGSTGAEGRGGESAELRQAARDSDRVQDSETPQETSAVTQRHTMPPRSRRQDSGAFPLASLRSQRGEPGSDSGGGERLPFITRLARAMGIGRVPSTPPPSEAAPAEISPPRFPAGIVSNRDGAQILVRNLGTAEMRRAGRPPAISGFLAEPVEISMRQDRIALTLQLDAPGRESPGREILDLTREQAQGLGIRFGETGEPLLPEGYSFAVETLRPAPSRSIVRAGGEGDAYYWAQITRGEYRGIPGQIDLSRAEGRFPNGEIELRILETRTETGANGETQSIPIVELPLRLETGPGESRPETLRVEVREGGELGIFMVNGRAQIREGTQFNLEPRPSPFVQITERAQSLANQIFGPQPEGGADPHADARRIFTNQLQIAFHRFRESQGNDDGAMRTWIEHFNEWSSLAEAYQEVYSGRFSGDRAEGIRQMLEMSNPGSEPFWDSLRHWQTSRPYILHDMGEPIHHAAHEVYGALFSTLRTELLPPGVRMGPFSLPESQRMGELLLSRETPDTEIIDPFIIEVNPADALVGQTVRQYLVDHFGAEVVERSPSGASELTLQHNGQEFSVLIVMGPGEVPQGRQQVAFPPSIPPPAEARSASRRGDSGAFPLPQAPQAATGLTITAQRRLDMFSDYIWNMEQSGNLAQGTSLETLAIPAQGTGGEQVTLHIATPEARPGHRLERWQVDERHGDGTLILMTPERPGSTLQVRPPQGHPFRVGDAMVLQRPVSQESSGARAQMSFRPIPSRPGFEACVIGRGSTHQPVHFLVPDRRISRRHAAIIRNTQTGELFIQNLPVNNSAFSSEYYGTHVLRSGDWQQVPTREPGQGSNGIPLAPGDRIALGLVYSGSSQRGRGPQLDAAGRAQDAVILEVSADGRSLISPGELVDQRAPQREARPAEAPRPMIRPQAAPPAPAPAPAARPAPGAQASEGNLNFHPDPSRPGFEILRIGSGRGGRPVDFEVPDRQVSRAHALMSRDTTTGTLTIQDLASNNGTYLYRNGDWVRVRQATELRPGDFIALGRVYDEAPPRQGRRGRPIDRARDAVVLELSADGQSLRPRSEMVDRGDLPVQPPTPALAERGASARTGHDEVLENAAGDLFLMQIRPEGSDEPVTDGIEMNVTQVRPEGQNFEITVGDPNGIYHQTFTFTQAQANEMGLLHTGTRVVLARIEAEPRTVDPGREHVSTFDQARIAQAAHGIEGQAEALPMMPAPPPIFHGTFPHAQLQGGPRLPLPTLGREGTIVLGRNGDMGREALSALGTVSGRHLSLRSLFHEGEGRWVYEVRDGAMDQNGAWTPSANGTFIVRQGQSIRVGSGRFAELQPGDVVTFGPPEFPGSPRFRWEAPEMSPSPQVRTTLPMGDFARLHPEILQGRQFFQSHAIEGQLSDGLVIPGRRTVYLEGADRFVEGPQGGDRERIVWNRSQDQVLDQFLTQTLARVQEQLGIRQLNPNHPQFEEHLTRALEIFRSELQRQFRAPGMSPRRAMRELDAFASERSGQNVLVGEVLQMRIPFCRHLALVTQAFLVDMGVRNARLQRGYLGAEAHVYNEVNIGGQRRIIEITDAFWNDRSILTQPGAELVYSSEGQGGEVR